MVLKAEPDLVVLAGWLHIFGDGFLDIMNRPTEPEQQPIPVINLHPALPGAFDGANAIGRAYEAFQKGEITRSGAMVHRVVKEVDRGKPVVVKEVPLEKGETIEAFQKRLHEVEWEIIVLATAKVLEEIAPVQVSNDMFILK